MANNNPSPIGGTSDALFLKTFAGEVLASFEETNVMMDKHMVRSIVSGKSASFPAMGKAEAAYHTPGHQLVGQSGGVPHAERVILIDDFLVSDIFVAKIDELKNHYDVRAEYTKQIGEALARKADKQLLQLAVLAARDTTPLVTGGNAGETISHADMGTASQFIASLYDAAAKMDEKDIPVSDRYVFVKPSMFYKLVVDKNLVNQDFSIGNGDYAKGIIDTAAGFKVVKTNNLPTTDLSGTTVTGEKNTYYADFSKVVGVAMHKSAVATVKLQDLMVSKTADDGDFMTQYNGSLLTAKMAVGHGILRNEAAIELATV